MSITKSGRIKSAVTASLLALAALIAPAVPAQAAVASTVTPEYTQLGAGGAVAFTINVTGLSNTAHCLVDTAVVTLDATNVTDEVGSILTSTTAKIQGTLPQFTGDTTLFKDLVWTLTFKDDPADAPLTCSQATATKTFVDYRYYAVPTIDSVSPTSGTSAGGTIVTLTGTGLDDGDTDPVVKFGTATATIVSSNATQIKVLSPAKPSSYDDIELTNRGGVDTIAYTYLTIPSISSFELSGYDGVAAGDVAGGDIVYIYGTGFDNVVSVLFGDSPATISSINSAKTRITVTTPAHVAGAVYIKVSDGTNTVTSAGTFQYTAAPTITAVSPNTGGLLAGTSVVITGTNFYGVLSVKFDTSEAVSFVVNSPTQITAVAPAHAAGAVKVSVTNPADVFQTPTNVYTYATSAITTVSPAVGTSIGGTAVTITGVGLGLTTAVKFGTVAATSFTVNQAGTSIVAVSPAGTGTVSINLTVGAATVSKSNAFTYVDAPVVTSISPRKGSKAGGTTVTIVGSNLQLLSSVKLGELSATSITVNADGTQATFVTPISANPGTVNLRLTAAGGAVTFANAFTFQLPSCVSGAIGQIQFAAAKASLTPALKLKLDAAISMLRNSGCSTLVVKRFKLTVPGTSTLKAMNTLSQKRANTAVKYIKAQLAKAGLTVIVSVVKLPKQVTKMAYLDAVKSNRVVKFSMK